MMKKKILILSSLVLLILSLTGCDEYYGKLEDDFEKKGQTLYNVAELKAITGEKIPVLLTGKVESNVLINEDYFVENLDEVIALKLRVEEYVTKTKTVDGKTEKYKKWIFDDYEYHEPTKLFISDFTVDLKSNYVVTKYYYDTITTTRELKKYIDYHFTEYVKDGKFRENDERYEYSIIRKNNIKGVLGYVSNGEFLMNENHQIYIIEQ